MKNNCYLEDGNYQWKPIVIKYILLIITELQKVSLKFALGETSSLIEFLIKRQIRDISFWIYNFLKQNKT